MFWETRSCDQMLQKKKKKGPILGHTIKQLIGGGFVGGEVQNKIIFAQVKIK